MTSEASGNLAFLVLTAAVALVVLLVLARILLTPVTQRLDRIAALLEKQRG